MIRLLGRPVPEARAKPVQHCLDLKLPEHPAQRPHSGTRCSWFTFVRMAGTVHTPSSRSISVHTAHRTSPHRATVSTRNSNTTTINCPPNRSNPTRHGVAHGGRPIAQGRAAVEDPKGEVASPARRAARDQEVAVGHRHRAAQGARQIAAPEGHDRVADPGEGPARQDREGSAAADREAGSPAGKAPRDPDDAVEGAVRPQEREAGNAAFRALARPTARRTRPWPHPAARSRRTHGRA